MDVRPLTRLPFTGRIVGSTLGDIAVHRITADASRVLRTPKAIAASDPEHLHVFLLLAGGCRVAQDGRLTEVGPHELCSYDTSRPFEILCLVPRGDVLMLSVPRVLLRQEADRLYGRTAMRVPASDGIASFIVPFLRSVADGVLTGTLEPTDYLLEESVVSVIAGLYAYSFDRRPTFGKETPALLTLRAKRFIDEHLSDPALSPGSVAQACFISVRYLHKLFAGEGTTVCEWIRERRLERCRRDLRDPLLMRERVADIAAKWGFRSVTHFSTLFHSAYGCTPREWRRAHLPS